MAVQEHEHQCVSETYDLARTSRTRHIRFKSYTALDMDIMADISIGKFFYMSTGETIFWCWVVGIGIVIAFMWSVLCSIGRFFKWIWDSVDDLEKEDDPNAPMTRGWAR